MSEPVAVISLAYAEPLPTGSRVWRGIVRVCHPLALFGCVVAWVLLVFVDVETVVFTGPVLLALGVVLTISGVMAHSRRAMAFGIAHAAICLLFFGLVLLADWRPNDAEWPFAVMGGIYTTVSMALAAAPWVRRSFKDPLVKGTPVTS